MQQSSVTTAWRAADIARIDASPLPEIPVIGSGDTRPALSGVHLWDMWPVCLTDGTTADFEGVSLWMILSAPATDNPDQRHDVARIRLMSKRAGVWTDRGNLLPDGFAPGTREWAGSAVFDPDTGFLTLYFTLAGRPGDITSYEQRMFEARTPLDVEHGRVSLGFWSALHELLVSDGDLYVDTRTTAGGAGLIKGFRDPAYFCDPLDHREYILFTGSNGRSLESHNGVIGFADRTDEGWQLRPPLISGDGINNEFERPHIVWRDGLYYLFWSTQRHVFHPGGPSGPNGLYGMVAEKIGGPYRPLNGTGLVAANPAAEPFQGYSWVVTASLEVVSFVDLWGMQGRTRHSHPGTLATQFGGTPAPVFRLALAGDCTSILA